MSKYSLYLILCCVSLTGCFHTGFRAGDVYLCDDCYMSTEKRDKAVYKMKLKFPVNNQVVDIMNNDQIYIVKEHTREYDGILFGSGNIVADIILLPITLPFSVLGRVLGMPISYDYGMNLVKDGSSTSVFVAYSSLAEEYPSAKEREKKYNIITIPEYEKRQTEEYIKKQEHEKQIALKKQAEEQKRLAKEQERLAEQQERKEQREDCEQAIAKLNQRKLSRATDEQDLYDFRGAIVVDFASKGVIVEREWTSFEINNFWAGDFGWETKSQRYFIYTRDTDYATNEDFRPNGILYKKAGNYRYEAILGNTVAIPAFKATKYPISEIELKTYLKNKELNCDFIKTRYELTGE